MEREIVKVEDLSLSFGAIQALKNVSLKVQEGELLAIIGPNGAGKTALLNSISGFYRPQKGRILFDGRDLTRLRPDRIAQLGISRTFQQIELYSGLTVLGNLMAARHNLMRYGILASSLYFWRAQREEVRHREVVEEIIDFLDMEAFRKHVAGDLPYGVQKRVELGRALAQEPSLLLLDEPMAGMTLEEKEDMVRFILDVMEAKWKVLRRAPTVVLVEHDMGVVMDIAERVVVLDWGQVIAEGSPKDVMGNPAVISAYLGRVGQNVS